MILLVHQAIGVAARLPVHHFTPQKVEKSMLMYVITIHGLLSVPAGRHMR